MSCGWLCQIPWCRMVSWEWRCSWSSADRRCSNIWSIDNFIAYLGVSYIRGFTVFVFANTNTVYLYLTKFNAVYLYLITVFGVFSYVFKYTFSKHKFNRCPLIWIIPQSLGTVRRGHAPFIFFILLPIYRAKLPNSKRIVLVPKCYV